MIEDFTAHLTNLDRESESEENIPSSKKNIIDHYLKKLQGENITITDNKEEDSNNHLNKTLIVYNPKCTLHGDFTDSNPLMRLKRRMNQVENPDRINVLFQPPFGVLLSDFCIERFSFREVQQPACLADILRVHDYNYIESIYKYCNRLKDQNSNNCYKYDSDTYINQHSWESAIHAAGCVIDAVDQIMDNEGTINKVTNAFCLVRPPGHHAGYYGKVE